MSAENITRSLVKALLHQGVLEGDVDELLSSAGARGEQLVESGLLSESGRLKALARLLHLDYAELPEGFKIAQTLLELIPAETVKRYEMVPMELDGDVLRIAVPYPYEPQIEDQIHGLTGKSVKLSLCERKRINAILEANRLDRYILKDVSDSLASQKSESEDSAQYRHDLADDRGESVVKLANQVFRDAINRRCSDIHFESGESGLAIKYRVDGVLLPSEISVGSRHAEQLISRTKVMAGLDIAEKRIPQDGRFRLVDGVGETDVRVSVLPTGFGEDVVLRLLDQNLSKKDGVPIKLADLGLSEGVLERFRASIHEPFGMVLLTGPTGSGKTTTLYAALNETNTGMEKVITIEDPVEYQLPGVVQIPVNEKKGLGFARGLRAILRHDPDKIMVGEIRDPDTAEIAVQAAMTGHLVFSTVHANSTMDVVGRMSHMGVDRHNLISSLKCILGQRLVRRVCGHCVGHRAPKPAETAPFTDRDMAAPAQVPDPVGCEQCDYSGYRGRFGVAEFVYLTQSLKELLLDRASLAAIREELDKQSFVELRQDALDKVVQGHTTVAEVERVTQGTFV